MDSLRVSEYINEIFVEQDEVISSVVEQTPMRGLPMIEVCPDEGLFIQLLVRACGAKNALEIGTLGGYSGIWIARGLAEGGKLITLEKEAAHAQVAREHFSAAGLGERVEVRVGDAHQILNTLAPEGPFDFVFVDAEKSGYRAYYEEVLPLNSYWRFNYIPQFAERGKGTPEGPA